MYILSRRLFLSSVAFGANCIVVGYSTYDSKEFVSIKTQLKQSGFVFLKTEENNKVDNNAITSVFSNGDMRISLISSSDNGKPEYEVSIENNCDFK